MWIWPWHSRTKKKDNIATKPLEYSEIGVWTQVKF